MPSRHNRLIAPKSSTPSANSRPEPPRRRYKRVFHHGDTESRRRRKKPKAGETTKDTKDDKGFGLDFLRVPLCPRRLALALSVTPCLRGENALSISSLLIWPNQRRCY